MTKIDAEMPEAAIAALRDLVESLRREKVDCDVNNLPNGHILCTWRLGTWVVSATITPDWQIIKYVAVGGGV